MVKKQNTHTSTHKNQETRPPILASALLSFVLPAHLKEPILGDLEEAFRKLTSSNAGNANPTYWYWQQVIRSTFTYIWQGRGSTMAYLLGFIFFIIMNILIISFSADFSVYVNGPSIIAVLPTALVLSIAATSFSSLKAAATLTFGEPIETSLAEAKSAHRFIKVFGNQSLLLSFIAILIGAIAMLANMDNYAVLRPALIVCLLPLFYALLVKSLCYSAEQKLSDKYLSS